MTHAMSVRATSLGAAALMLGAGLFSALNMTYHIVDWAPPDAPAIDMQFVPPPPPPPMVPPQTSTPPPQQRVEELQTLALPFEPFSDTSAAPEQASFVLPTPGPVEITAPDWIRRPRDLAAYYPRRALERGVEGEVQLECIVGLTGQLRCVVRSETPQNIGLADAALRIAADHRMRPAMRDGVPVEGRYNMRVPFDLH